MTREAAADGGLLELACTDLTRDGRGVARHQGRVVLVQGALPGDLVRVRLQGSPRRGPLHGQVRQWLHPSPQRRRPPCILADHCGGCSLQALEDDAEQDWKFAHLRETVRRLADLEVPIRPLVPAGPCLGYRNRAVIPLERDARGRLRAGFYRRGSHRIVNMSRCPVLDPRIDALIAPIKADLEASGWPVDRHGGDRQGGGLRHLALRVGHHDGEVLLCLIAAHRRLPGLEDLAREWLRRWPSVVGVCVNLQPAPTNLLMGTRTETLAGRGWLRDRFCGHSLRIAADTFFQVNTAAAEQAAAAMRQALGPGPGRLIDAYCGIGTYSLPLAADGWDVLGIEQHPGAVRLAVENARENRLDHRCRFERAAVADVLAAHLSVDAPAALLLDPPRRGLEAAVLSAIESSPPPRILYLSCDPATLARDLARLCGTAAPYRLRWLHPFDFFPNTTHLETLALLERR